MKERIIQIMEREGMSQAQFAQAIGVQRAAMSHIISGRNNPSLDVVMKILSCFPAINPDWLLLGKGNIFRENAKQPDTLFPSYSTSKIEVLSDNEVQPSNMKQTNEMVDEKNESNSLYTTRNVSKIMVFYSDNTYEMFVPEKLDSE